MELWAARISTELPVSCVRVHSSRVGVTVLVRSVRAGGGTISVLRAPLMCVSSLLSWSWAARNDHVHFARYKTCMFGLTKLVGPPAMGADGICSYSAVGMALGAVAVCLGVYVGGLVGGECQRRIQRWVHRRFWVITSCRPTCACGTCATPTAAQRSQPWRAEAARTQPLPFCKGLKV